MPGKTVKIRSTEGGEFDCYLAQPAGGDKAPAASALDAVLSPLAARLKIEAEPDVREAICDAIGRLPYVSAAQVELAERILIETASRADTLTDRLGGAP